jgi:anti-sigma factor RsiW
MMDEPKITLSPELLHKFVTGQLDEAENEQIMVRLSEDEASLELVDALWNKQASQTAVSPVPPLEPERAKKMRRRLIHQIHRADLAVNVARLGTKGFGLVAMSLLRPLLAIPKRESRNRRRPRGND